MHVASVSTGKDSQATMLLMLERIHRSRCRFIMADTGNEDAAVWEHKAYLEGALGITIDVLRADFSEQITAKREFIARDQRVGRRDGRRIRWTNKAKRRALAVLQPSGNPFLDLCMWKGRFPSRKAQFCTEQLKTVPLVEYQMALVDQGFGVVSWQGVRRDESANRKNAKKMERVGPRLWQFRPIVEWTAQQTVDYSLARGLLLNRLYSEGFDRVGCMPCINCGKKAISNTALRRPAEIDRLGKWELMVGQASKQGLASFFPDPNRDSHLDKRGIVKVVQWAKTTRGGRQFDLLKETDSASCSSSYGLCDRP